MGIISGFSNPCRTSEGENMYIKKNSARCQKFFSSSSALAAPALELMRLRRNLAQAGRAGIQRGATAPSRTTGTGDAFCKRRREETRLVHKQAGAPGRRNTALPGGTRCSRSSIAILIQTPSPGSSEEPAN